MWHCRQVDPSRNAPREWDFFISYTQTDRNWAEWIAWVLEEDSYRVLVQAWDFVPGSNWILGMQTGTRDASRTIAVLSDAYLESVYGGAEWQAAVASDPDGTGRKLLIVRVAPCERPGLLAAVVGVDLFGITEGDARSRLEGMVVAAAAGRMKPSVAPAFPGVSMPYEPEFPGSPTAGSVTAAQPGASEPSVRRDGGQNRTLGSAGADGDVGQGDPGSLPAAREAAGTAAEFTEAVAAGSQDATATVRDGEMASDAFSPPDPDCGVPSRGSPDEPQAGETTTATFPNILALTICIIILAAIIVGIVASHAIGGGHHTPAAVTQNCTATGPVVFVVSGRQDSPAPALAGRMETAAMSAIDDASSIGVVNLDGRPGLLFAGDFGSVNSKSVATRLEREEYLANLARTVSGVRAKYPHADVLDALEVAGEAVRAACSHGGSIYLADSGLQETGLLDFRKPGLLASSPAQVVATLAGAHDIPHLSGMTIVLVGIGDTAPPQGQLSIGQRTNLINIWSAIATAAGAKVQIDTQPRDNAAPTHVPSVQLVPTQ